MKNFPLAIALIAGASPAAAQQVAPHRPSSADAARLLNEPATQQVIGLEIASLAGIVLDTKVGPLAALANPRDHIRPDDTLHSIELRHDPEFDRHLYEHSRRAVAAAGTVAGSAIAEEVELHRTATRLRAALEPLLGAAKALNTGQWLLGR